MATVTNHADEATVRLRQEAPPFGLDQKEAICPACNLAYWVAAGVAVVCHDCAIALDLI